MKIFFLVLFFSCTVFCTLDYENLTGYYDSLLPQLSDASPTLANASFHTPSLENPTEYFFVRIAFVTPSVSGFLSSKNNSSVYYAFGQRAPSYYFGQGPKHHADCTNDVYKATLLSKPTIIFIASVQLDDNPKQEFVVQSNPFNFSINSSLAWSNPNKFSKLNLSIFSTGTYEYGVYYTQYDHTCTKEPDGGTSCNCIPNSRYYTTNLIATDFDSKEFLVEKGPMISQTKIPVLGEELLFKPEFSSVSYSSFAPDLVRLTCDGVSHKTTLSSYSLVYGTFGKRFERNLFFNQTPFVSNNIFAVEASPNFSALFLEKNGRNYSYAIENYCNLTERSGMHNITLEWFDSYGGVETQNFSVLVRNVLQEKNSSLVAFPEKNTDPKDSEKARPITSSNQNPDFQPSQLSQPALLALSLIFVFGLYLLIKKIGKKFF